MKLGEMARIYRYARRRDPAYDDERPDRRLIWNEVNQSDFDPQTGFVMRETLSTVALPQYPDRFRVEPHDTLMVFIGTPKSLGKVGLVIDDNPLAIPGRSLCIIRPLDQWKLPLHWLLRQESTRKEILKLIRPADARSKMTIPIPALRELDIGPEDAFRLSGKSIQEQGEALIEEYLENRQRIAGLLGELDDEIRLDERMSPRRAPRGPRND